MDSTIPSPDNDRFRTVRITGALDDMTAYDITKQITSGIITHITQGVMGRNLPVQTVLITFLTAEAAKHCADHFNTTSPILKMLTQGARGNITAELESCTTLHDHYASALETNTISRVLLLTKLNPEITHAAVALNLTKNLMQPYGQVPVLERNDILAIETVRKPDGSRDLRVHFNSFRNAIRGYRAVKNKYLFEGCQPIFDADPCDPEAEGRLDLKQDLPGWVEDMTILEPHERGHMRSYVPVSSPRKSSPYVQGSGTAAKGWMDFACAKAKALRSGVRDGRTGEVERDHAVGEKVSAGDSVGLGIDMRNKDVEFHDAVGAAELSSESTEFHEAEEMPDPEKVFDAGRRDSVLMDEIALDDEEEDLEWHANPMKGPDGEEDGVTDHDGPEHFEVAESALIAGIEEMSFSPEIGLGACFEPQQLSLLD
ncbi:hypothetical protein BDZ85DRAFT_251032 [Elsinoe ampelina]|uniref:Uncharacterized protein n=1 Tax=Elsinoe ampelina TaxID=302913 RepID=A0A6A6G9Z9_9PEZI|nr:hypothetical protein BDZ85DRAFT_251032 [Elsinoe ampelina]